MNIIFPKRNKIIRNIVLINEHNIKTTSEAENCEELRDINNGCTLCVECHRKTETYGGSKKKEQNDNK